MSSPEHLLLKNKQLHKAAVVRPETTQISTLFFIVQHNLICCFLWEIFTVSGAVSWTPLTTHFK